MAQKQTSFQDVYQQLIINGGPRANAAYNRWRERQGFDAVVEFVESFTHKYLYEITPDYLNTIAQRTDHALGNVQTEEQMEEVENFTCPFALQHLFHWFIESKQAVPTWQDFRVWIGRDVKTHWLALLHYNLQYENRSEGDKAKIRRATKWRLGKFYLSAIRELDVLCRLRTHYGIDLSYHLLADVLLRVDFWVNETLLCLYFPNKMYRDGQAGRKPPAEVFFEGSRNEFSILHMAIERQGFGKRWLASEESLQNIVKEINESL